jgi:hypothetical protein
MGLIEVLLQEIPIIPYFLTNTNTKENLLKFIGVYPEYKDDISKFIDLDSIIKENEYRIESGIIKNEIELDISNSNKDNHIDESGESNKFSRFLFKLMK